MIAFYLKKVLGMLLMPIPLTLILMLAGLALLRRRPRLGRGLIGVAALWLALTSWHPVADRLLAPFEDNYPVFDLSQPVEVVVVLGGCHATDNSVPPAGQLCSSSLFRLTEGLRILAANPQALLTVSGYAGPDARPHAGVMQEIAISMGVDAGRIRAFRRPGIPPKKQPYWRRCCKAKPLRWSAKPRTCPGRCRFFTARGLAPLPAPAMKMSSPDSDWRLEARAALKSERAFYEGLGRLWQWLRHG